MRARYWMIGCLIGLAGMGNAMASDSDACDITAGNHATADSSTHDAGSTSGDALGLNRDEPAAKHTESSGNDSRSNGATGSSEHGGGGGVSAPTHARPATLGWQSLLPGSIQ